jgi:hypothetical protein
VPLLVLGLAPLSAEPVDGHNLTIPIITVVDADSMKPMKDMMMESSEGDMMESKDMMEMAEEHTHAMGTPDDESDDVTHSHTHSHVYDMGTSGMEDDDVMIKHTHDLSDNDAAGDRHRHAFHINIVGEEDSEENEETDDEVHYHLGGSGDHDHDDYVKAGITAAVTGSSTLTFGVNLNTNGTGITNTTDVKLAVTVIDKESVNSGEKDTDDLYAYIELTDLQWVIDQTRKNAGDKHAGAKGTPDVKATTHKQAPILTSSLRMGPLTVTTFTAPETQYGASKADAHRPGVEIDYVDPKDAIDGDKTDVKDVETFYRGSGGLTVAYEIAPVVLTLGVVSMDDWVQRGGANELKGLVAQTGTHIHDSGTPKDKTDDVTHRHSVPEKTTAASHTHGPDGVIIPVVNEKKAPSYIRDDGNVDNAYAIHGKVELAIGEDADLEVGVIYPHEYSDTAPIGLGAKATFDLGDVDPFIAFDGQIPTDDSKVPWDVGAGLTWSLFNNADGDSESSFETHLTMYIPPGDVESQVSASVTLTEGDDDKGGLAGLGATLKVGLADITGDASHWMVDLKAHYKVSDIKPYFAVTFDSKADAKMPFTAGLELSMIDNLVTTVQYKSTDLSGAAPDKGEVTAALKISY